MGNNQNADQEEVEHQPEKHQHKGRETNKQVTQQEAQWMGNLRSSKKQFDHVCGVTRGCPHRMRGSGTR